MSSPRPTSSPVPRRIARRLLTLTAAGAAGAVAGGLWGAKQISGPLRPPFAFGFSPFEVGVDHIAQDVTFHAADGTRLAGWWLPHEAQGTPGQVGAKDVVIVSHGHRGAKAEMLGIGPGLWRAGHEVFLFDFRGNGDSGDGPQSLAFHEQQDLRAAIDQVLQLRPGARVSLVGFSMGAATSILVAAQDERVRAVVADSSFADMAGVVSAAARRMRLPAALGLLVDWATGLRYGYRFAQVAPVEVVGSIAPRPLLLIHCTGDSIIPIEHAHRLAAAAGEGSELRIVEGPEHCGAYFEDRPGHIAAVAAFLDR